MNDTRARFEEIWPVPDVIFWSNDIGRYAPMPDEVLQYERLNEQWAHEHNARLDTFTRCQETTDVYVGIIDELIRTIQWHFQQDEISSDMGGDDYGHDGAINDDCVIGRAKKFMEHMK